MAKRIIDAKLEKEIKESVDKHIKGATKEIEAARAKAEKEMGVARTKAEKELGGVKTKAKKEVDIAKLKFDDTAEEAIESMKEKPVEWVAGAFVAGLILGKLLSK